jgi:quercetin dioxygenase-like cupin family protein
MVRESSPPIAGSGLIIARMTKKIAMAAGLFAAALAAARVARSQSPDDPLDPIRVAGDTHRMAFENTLVRVLDVHLPPGKVEPRHRHPHGMSVYFTDWDAKVTADGAAPEVHHRKAGTFAWNEAIVHRVENAGPTEGHILRIELKY